VKLLHKCYFDSVKAASNSEASASDEANAQYASGEATLQTLHKTKASSGGAKAALPNEARAHGEAKSVSPKAKRTAFAKAKLNASQPKGVILQSPRVLVLAEWAQSIQT